MHACIPSAVFYVNCCRGRNFSPPHVKDSPYESDRLLRLLLQCRLPHTSLTLGCSGCIIACSADARGVRISQNRQVAAYFTLNGRGFCHFFTKNRCILKDFGYKERLFNEKSAVKLMAEDQLAASSLHLYGRKCPINAVRRTHSNQRPACIDWLAVGAVLDAMTSSSAP